MENKWKDGNRGKGCLKYGVEGEGVKTETPLCVANALIKGKQLGHI